MLKIFQSRLKRFCLTKFPDYLIQGETEGTDLETGHDSVVGHNVDDEIKEIDETETETEMK